MPVVHLSYGVGKDNNEMINDTPITTIAGLDRAIFTGDGSRYAILTYGSNPLLKVDQATWEAGGKKIKAQTGGVVVVPTNNVGIPANDSHVCEFISANLANLEQVSNCITDYQSRICEISGVKSYEQAKSANSGEQIMEMETRHEAYISSAGSQNEKAENKISILRDKWLTVNQGDQDRPSYSTKYPGQYTRKSLQAETQEQNSIISAAGNYKTVFGDTETRTGENGEEITTPGQLPAELEGVRDQVAKKLTQISKSSSTTDGLAGG